MSLSHDKMKVNADHLPPIVFHSLRHSSITYKLKLNQGDIKSVQGDSGHAQASMGADQYSHILDENWQEKRSCLKRHSTTDMGQSRKPRSSGSSSPWSIRWTQWVSIRSSWRSYSAILTWWKCFRCSPAVALRHKESPSCCGRGLVRWIDTKRYCITLFINCWKLSTWSYVTVPLDNVENSFFAQSIFAFSIGRRFKLSIVPFVSATK